MPVQRPDTATRRVAIVGGGPAGLMAAEAVCAAGFEVDLYDRMGSVGRKVLIAGKGGLNLTHGEPLPRFLERYGPQSATIARWIERFPPAALRDWARDLGVDTMVGSSGRVFPADLKAAPLLRGWVRRLRSQGTRFHMQHRWLGWSGQGALLFESPIGNVEVDAEAVILALGGGSWGKLGSDGRWVPILREAGFAVCDLQPSNIGFEAAWSEHFIERCAGQPVKPVAMSWVSADGNTCNRQGEFVITAYGIEGSLVYAATADLRAAVARHGRAEVTLDLVPGQDARMLAQNLRSPRGKRSFSEWLRRRTGISGTRAALLRELTPDCAVLDGDALAARIKRLPLGLLRTRPLDEAISSAGGIELAELDAGLMLKQRPGVFCAGEMLDWEAPTGGYLLNACMASGLVAAEAAVAWLRAAGGSRPAPPTCKS